MITLKIKDLGDIVIELDRDNAPISCANFTKLAKDGFYDGLTFHRVIKGFMIQGGDPEGIGIGGPGYSIKGEFKANGVDNSFHIKEVLFQWRGAKILIRLVHNFLSAIKMMSFWMDNMQLLEKLHLVWM